MNHHYKARLEAAEEVVIAARLYYAVTRRLAHVVHARERESLRAALERWDKVDRKVGQ